MRNKLPALSTVVAFALVLGCHGGNTGGGEVDHSSGFAPGASGSLSLDLNTSTLSTGEFDGFRVRVKNEDGDPVSDLRITCDTEDGLALIEPTSGFEHTDSSGQFSGKVGCERAGSYLLVCRAPAPSGIRDSQTVVCNGDRPSGFDGWPGSAGGGLGGGSSNGNTISGVRISSITASDTGVITEATTSIDIVQSVCTEGETDTAEPFFDTAVRFTVVNNSPYLIKFTGLRYVVANAYASGSSGTSGTLSLTGSAAQAVDANGGTGTIDSLLFEATGGTKSVYNGSAISQGFKNITFTLIGENELGEEFEVTGSTALSFNNFNRCED